MGIAMLRTGRLVTATSIALVMIAGTVGASALAGARQPGREPVPEPAVEPVRPGAAGPADAMIARLQQHLRQAPDDGNGLAQLGAWYLQKARETADPGYHRKAREALQQSVEKDPDDLVAVTNLGVLALAEHRFQEAVTWGERAQRLSPDSAAPHGVIGDALVELGRYPAAFQAFQEMVQRRPDLNSYARVSYAREMTGDIEGAIEAMRVAAQSGGAGEAAAWAWSQLGQLRWTYRGDLDQADRDFQQALARQPGYAPGLAGLARVAGGRGQLERAIDLGRSAATLLPTQEHVALLADLLRAAGRNREAAQQEGLGRSLLQLGRAAGVDNDMEDALYEADLGDNAASAVETAQRAYRNRPSVKGADALAWALFRAGRAGEAQAPMAAALSLGSQDPLVHYHAGRVALAAGDTRSAQRHLAAALSANPHFSFRYADDARAALTALELEIGGGQ